MDEQQKLISDLQKRRLHLLLTIPIDHLDMDTQIFFLQEINAHLSDLKSNEPEIL